MSEHRRKAPPPQGGGRAAARRGHSGTSSGRRAAPQGATGSPSASYGPEEDERPPGGRAEARRAAQRGGSRRRAAGGGGGRGGGGRRGTGGPGGWDEPPKKRFIDYPRAGKRGAERWIPSWRLVTGTFIGFFGGLLAVAGVSYALVDVPEVAKAATAQNNVYYWADGSPMVATGGETNRQIIDYNEIPESMRYAVMSAENKTFETDKGVDPMGIARAVLNMAKGGQTQGGSTITQQYVKNARLDDQGQTFSRKFKELFISIKVGATKGKEEIMAGYLNTAYYGRGAYGIQAAARAYFNVDAKKLDASQTAFLAAVLKGSTYYDPAGSVSIDPSATPQANRQRAENRWKWILDEEVKDGHLSSASRNKYATFPKVGNPRSNQRLSGQVGYLVDLARAYTVKASGGTITEGQLRQGGYEIHTTFDKKKVQELENSVKKVQKESIDVKKRPDTDKYVQFGGASVNPASGAIEAIYGGENATKHFTNNADATGAQVGSTFKPFVLAAAMKYGVRDPSGPPEQSADQRTIVSPKSIYSGKDHLKIKKYDNSVWTDKEGGEWLQANDGGDDYNPPSFDIDLREGMRVSANSVYVQLGMDVGLDKVQESAVSAGILQDSLKGAADYPSFSIGTTSPSTIRMAGAYATFANSGKQRDPYSVKEVDHGGKAVYRHEDVAKQAFDPQVADNVTDVLKTVVDKGTGTKAKLVDRPAAGKTGTTDDNKSAWFVGYTPQLSTAISMYRMDDNEKKGEKREFLKMYGTGGEKKIHGASFPSVIWHDYMETALKGKKVENFPKPEPIGKVVGAKPSPTPSPSVTESSDKPTPSTTPSATHSSEPPPSPTPDTSETSCAPLDWDCEHNGDDDGGGDGDPGDPGDGGNTGDPDPTTSEPDEPGFISGAHG
ncbi:transglycosylase domain-containing protein [Streptomyces tsukubensis]|uniref:Penicillin-binding protein n=1 Tax=Streptomyces tsukubensis TaxID=83656 RepID=A0A1V4A8Z0_9ACTN|nr:transglycosylase domain-containing protein [Streptomyces tsukubensis]OON79257.1 penicillin-binding protein [Streptomyces tsukubensis]QFR94624.1 penicillin-binding protein [Streptomyces tsukubensis]